MKSMVVLFAVCAVACGSLVPLAQPVYSPALILDPHGRPLDTAEVINARAIHLQAKALEGHYAHGAVVAPLAHSVVAPVIAAPLVAAPAAVSHQSRVDVRSSPAVVSHAIGSPLLAHSALSYGALPYTGHYLKKRSLGHIAYAAPVIAPSAVSHQSRVDVISSPAVVSHAVAAPVLAHSAPIVAHAAPVVALAPSAVSHQSRVDVRTSPAVVAHSIAAPVASVYSAYGAVASPFYGSHSGLALSHGHYLKKRSAGYLAVSPLVHSVPSAVSHQSRVDVISEPAVVSHSVVAPAVYAAPVVSHFAPISHSALWTSPLHLRAAHW